MKTKNEFTAREIEVLNLLAEGLNNKEVANKLSISVHTVKSYLESIYPKLDVHNRLQAVIKAIKMEIIR